MEEPNGIELPGAGRIEEYRRGSGQRVLAGADGLMMAQQGQIYFLRAPRVGIDLHLWAALKAGVNACEVRIRVRTVDSASVHVTNSRHYIGCAADVDLCSYMGDPWKMATLQNGALKKLHAWYRKHGWAVGEPAGRPGLILGPIRTRYNPTRVNHATHLHISCARPVHPGVGPELEPEGAEWEICPCDEEQEEE